MSNNMKHEYNELIPDEIIDTFYLRIKECIDEDRPYDMWVRNLEKINAGNIPDKIKKLISK